MIIVPVTRVCICG